MPKQEYTAEFKAQAVKHAQTVGIAPAAKELDSLTELILVRLSQVFYAAMWTTSQQELTASSAAWKQRSAAEESWGAMGIIGAMAGRRMREYTRV